MSSFTMSYRKVGNREHRRDKRLKLPIFSLELDGVVCETIDWSLGGLLVGGYTGSHKANDAIDVEIKVKDETGDYVLKTRVFVIRVDQKSSRIALRFEEISPQVYDFFERGFAQRYRKNQR